MKTKSPNSLSIALILFLAFTTTAVSQIRIPRNSSDATADESIQVITIPLGAQVQVDDVTITFVALLEDSRCPKDVTCVWQGEVKCTIAIAEAGKVIEPKTLVIREPNVPIIYENDLVIMQATTVSPYPSTATPENTSKIAYELLLKVIDK